MDVSGSGWSSGCESGWTLYLDESYVYQRDNSHNVVGGHNNQNQNFIRANSTSYEEDLSMVSDASSGPPHFYHEDQEEGGYGRTQHHRGKSSKKEKTSKKEKKQMNSKQYQQHHHLDDTASSPAISYAKMYDNPSTNQASFMGYAQNFSETHFQGNDTMNNQYGYWHSDPFNTNSAEPSKLRGRRWQ